MEIKTWQHTNLVLVTMNFVIFFFTCVKRTLFLQHRYIININKLFAEVITAYLEIPYKREVLAVV